MKKTSFREWFSDHWVESVPYVMLCIIIVAMGLLNSNTLSFRYIFNKTDAALSLVLVAIGQTFVLLTGGFDLSVGGVICIVNCIAASKMSNSAGSILFWCILCILLGVLIGMFNGLIIEKTGLQPFIVTLATQSVCMGIALLVMKVDGGNVPMAYMDVLLKRFGGVPVSVFILVLLIVAWRYCKKKSFCMDIYAFGSNKKNARLNGVNILKTSVTAYAISGGFAALSGLFRTAAVASGSPTAGADFVMTSISAAVIGGTALSGGKGGVIGSIVGAFILRYISDLLVFLKVSSYWSSLIQGVILILAVALSAYGVVLQKRKEGLGG